MVRGRLRRLEEEDGIYLETILTNQETAPKCYELSPADEKKLRLSVINSTEGRQISVTVPADEHDEAAIEPQGSSEQQDRTSEVDENDASSQPDESDNVNSLEYLAEMEGLPGLTAPAGAVYEQGFMGIVFSKEACK